MRFGWRDLARNQRDIAPHTAATFGVLSINHHIGARDCLALKLVGVASKESLEGPEFVVA